MNSLPAPPAPLPHNQPLPPNPYRQESQRSWRDAYDATLALQAVDGLRGRLLGYLLLEALDDHARSDVARWISEFGRKGLSLKGLSQLYIDYLFSPFYRPTQWVVTEAFSDHVAEWEKEEAMCYWDPPGSRAIIYEQIAAEERTLHRDRSECAVSGYYDVDAAREFPVPEDTPLSKTSISLILPELATPECDYFDMDEDQYCTRVFNAFSGIPAPELYVPQCYQLSNIVTLREDIRTLFAELFLWFQEVPNAPAKNTYFVCASSEKVLANIPSRMVTFSTKDELSKDLPEARRLKTHAAICRIAHLSGVRTYLRTDYEQENMDLGTSSDWVADRLEADIEFSVARP